MNDMGKITQTPHSPEMEQQILGALLSNNDLFHKISGVTTAEHFYDPVHGAIFKNIVGRIARDHVADAVTVAVDFETHDGLKSLGGAQYLARLVGGSISGSMVDHYARDLMHLWQRRTLVEALDRAREDVLNDGDPDVAKAGLEAVLSSLPDAQGQENAVSLLKSVTGALGDIHRAFQGEDVGLKTGLDAIDRRMGGMWPGDLVIVAGRPSMGKTALALSLASRAAKRGEHVGIVSLEMTDRSLAERFLAEETSIPYSDARRGDINEAEFHRIAAAAGELQSRQVSIIPPHVRDIASIHSALKKQKKKYGRLDLVVVDYLQLIRAKGNSANERVTEISQQLKAMAKLLDCPIIALSQLSRGVEARDDKRPILSDLRDSGSIEQDADAVLFCYRDHYYLSREMPPEKMDLRADYEDALRRSQNVMEVICAKQRMGAIGIDRIGCHMPTNRFWDLETAGDMDFHG